ncbi:ribonuclease domain-containing protein [Soonwooa sp.]|uniref:ribonuclease domain-containing protein n=1 Tax=Soonwooa sp. TaxID=1938592 RepID=UPI0026192113|nr:ribonuclease domain-containing protein [Soonwooa sp.]
MNPKLKTFLFFVVGALAGILVMYLISPSKSRSNHSTEVSTQDFNPNSDFNQDQHSGKKNKKYNENTSQDNGGQSIDALTKEVVVVAYIKAHQQLPDYYITKREAKSSGWKPSKGNLCDVLPGRAIGGDRFSNREKNLPTQGGRVYYEADVNYSCGHRDADRIVFSNDGLVFVSKDHYKTFQQQ